MKGLDIVGFFALGADLQEVPGLFQVRSLEQVFKFLFWHGIAFTNGTEHGKFCVTPGEQGITQRHHKALKIDTGRAIKGAFPAGETIPQGLALNAFRIQGELLHDTSGGPIIGVFSVEIQHGTDRRAFAALQTIVEIVFLYELSYHCFQVRHGVALF